MQAWEGKAGGNIKPVVLQAVNAVVFYTIPGFMICASD